MNKRLLDKLLEHYRSGSDDPMTEEMQEYEQRLDYARDLLKANRTWDVRKKLIRRFGYSKNTAAQDVRDCMELFAYEFNGLNKEFEKAASIERLTRYRTYAERIAKTPKDYESVAKIELQIADMMGLRDKSEKEAPMIPGSIVIQIPTRGRTRIFDLDADKPDIQTIDLIENVHYSVEDMEKQLLDEKTEQ
jgi:hypothetical protein